MSDELAPDRTAILGVPVSVIDLARTTALVTRWSREGTPRAVLLRDVASLMLAVDEPRLLALHHRADLVLPDGMPLVWVARLQGHASEIGRVAGADLVDAVCAASVGRGLRHFFYGGKPGVAAAMASRLEARYPGLSIAGCLAPPMREIGADFAFDATALAEIETIRASRPDIVWVGLSSPKQDYWLMKAAPLLGGPVLLGVGAAFDFHSGAVRRAPPIMRDHGLEWLHRLVSEPRRLWRRYLILAPRFVWLVSIALVRAHLHPKR